MDSPPSIEPSSESPTARPIAHPPEDSKTRRIRYVFLFVMPFIMVSMMFATYVGTMHAPKVHGMQVAVVGTGAEADAVAAALASTPDDAVDPLVVASEAEARDMLASREISGAIVVPTDGSGGATVLTASAAGPSQAMMVQQTLVPVVAANAWDVSTEDVAPLPAGDSSGTAVLFGAMGMMLAAYVPLSLMLMAVPHLLSLRRFLPVLAGWAALTSTIIWLILGPLVGAVDGHYLEFLGVGMLTVAATGMAQLLFTKVIGPMAVLIGMLLFVVLGMPASNLAYPISSMPGFFSFLHTVLPLPAAGETLRSILYFDGKGAGVHLLTLAVWFVVALVLCLLKERKSLAIPGAPAFVDADSPLPAMAGGPVRSKRVRYAAVAGFPLSIIVLVVGVMSFSMHEPTVHELPVAVVGASLEQADQVAAGLEGSMGTMLDVRAMASVDEATDAIHDGEVASAFVLPQTQDGAAALYTSSAAGTSQQNVARAVFQQVAAEQGMALTETDVPSLTEHDTMGSNSLYIGMSWIMAGFLLLSVLRGGAPEVTKLRQFLPLLGGWAVGMSIWLWFLFDVLIGAVSGHAWAMIGFGALTIFAVSLFSALFTRTLGIIGVIPVMAVLMMAGVPASGGGLSLYMVPELFRGLNAVLPLPAAVEAVRSMVYFDGVGVGQNVLVIVVWAVVALLLNLLVDRWVSRRAAASSGSEDGSPGGRYPAVQTADDVLAGELGTARDVDRVTTG